MAPPPGIKPPTAKPKGIIRRAPKWAWFTVGGIVIGVVVIKFWRDRATDATASAEVATVDGQPTTGTPGASPGVIVPPVIIAPPGDNQFGGMAEVLGLIGDLGSTWGEIYGPIANLIPGLIPTPDDYINMINGGGNPTSGSPIVVTTPAPPQAAPSPIAPAPAPVAPQVPACPAGYPYRSDRGCYKVVCASGSGSHSKGHWHYYSTGAEIHVDNTC